MTPVTGTAEPKLDGVRSRRVMRVWEGAIFTDAPRTETLCGDVGRAAEVAG